MLSEIAANGPTRDPFPVVLGSHGRANILTAFLTNPETTFTPTALADYAGISKSPIYESLRTYSNLGLITTETRGQTRSMTLNVGHPTTEALQSVFTHLTTDAIHAALDDVDALDANNSVLEAVAGTPGRARILALFCANPTTTFTRTLIVGHTTLNKTTVRRIMPLFLATDICTTVQSTRPAKFQLNTGAALADAFHELYHTLDAHSDSL